MYIGYFICLQVDDISLIMDTLTLEGVNDVWIGITRKIGQRELFEWLDGRSFSETDKWVSL